MRRLVTTISICALADALGCIAGPEQETTGAALEGGPVQPSQPWVGPAGRDYPHGAITVQHFSVEARGVSMSYTVIAPAAPTPRRAPVLVYLMGNIPVALSSSISYEFYGAFYEHLARKGWVVIHPSNGFMSPDGRPAGTTINDVDEILADVTRQALAQLERNGPVRPAWDVSGMQLAIGGHSLGGLMAQFVADEAQAQGLPQPRALLLHDPTPVMMGNGTAADPMAIENLEIPDAFSRIPSSTYALVIHPVETLFGSYGVDPATLTLNEVHHMAESRRVLATIDDAHYSYLYVARDDHGSPAVESSHFSFGGTAHPEVNQLLENLLLNMGCCGAPILAVDATDWYGIWKPSVGLLEYAVRNRAAFRRFAFEVPDDPTAVRAMGYWSDGTAVNEMSTARDYGDYFVRNEALPPPPEPPGGLLIGGAPVLEIGPLTPDSSPTKYVAIANFWPDPVTITSITLVTLEGSSAFQLVPDPACAEEIPGGWGHKCSPGITFMPVASGIEEAELVVQYTVDTVEGQGLVVRRSLRGTSTD
jgi:hypothetical protein